MSTGYHY
jgi:hypothetical protein